MSSTTGQSRIELHGSRKVLCGMYVAVAAVALLATWRNGGPYTHSATAFLVDFWRDTKANNATRFLAVDILMFGLAAAIWMVNDARERGVRFVWAYIIGSFLVAVSVTYPLYLLARELRMKRSDRVGLRGADTALLTVLAAVLLAMTVWIDRGP